VNLSSHYLLQYAAIQNRTTVAQGMVSNRAGQFPDIEKEMSMII